MQSRRRPRANCLFKTRESRCVFCVDNHGHRRNVHGWLLVSATSDLHSTVQNAYYLLLLSYQPAVKLAIRNLSAQQSSTTLVKAAQVAQQCSWFMAKAVKPSRQVVRIS